MIELGDTSHPTIEKWRRPVVTASVAIVSASIGLLIGTVLGIRHYPLGIGDAYRDIECYPNGMPNIEGAWSVTDWNARNLLGKYEWRTAPTLMCKAFVRGDVQVFQANELWMNRTEHKKN